MVVMVVLIVVYTLGFGATAVYMGKESASHYKQVGWEPDLADGGTVIFFSLLWPAIWPMAGLGWIGKKIIKWVG